MNNTINIQTNNQSMPKFYIIGLVVIASLLLSGCASSQDWGWYVVDPTLKRGRINITFLLSGIPWTILLTICCVVISVVVGFFISLLGLSDRSYLLRFIALTLKFFVPYRH